MPTGNRRNSLPLRPLVGFWVSYGVRYGCGTRHSSTSRRKLLGINISPPTPNAPSVIGGALNKTIRLVGYREGHAQQGGGNAKTACRRAGEGASSPAPAIRHLNLKKLYRYHTRSSVERCIRYIYTSQVIGLWEITWEGDSREPLIGI